MSSLFPPFNTVPIGPLHTHLDEIHSSLPLSVTGALLRHPGASLLPLEASRLPANRYILPLQVMSLLFRPPLSPSRMPHHTAPQPLERNEPFLTSPCHRSLPSQSRSLSLPLEASRRPKIINVAVPGPVIALSALVPGPVIALSAPCCLRTCPHWTAPQPKFTTRYCSLIASSLRSTIMVDNTNWTMILVAAASLVPSAVHHHTIPTPCDCLTLSPNVGLACNTVRDSVGIPGGVDFHFFC